jgi:hypothetical protein
MGCRQQVGRRRALPRADVARRIIRARRSTWTSIADVRLLRPADFATYLGTQLGPDIRMVGFESSNTITNAGREQWQRNSGLVSCVDSRDVRAVARTTITIPFVRERTPRWAPS